MKFIVSTNVIASRPHERRPTGTPHARDKKNKWKKPPSIENYHFKVVKDLLWLSYTIGNVHFCNKDVIF